MSLVLPYQKGFVWVFTGAAPVSEGAFIPIDLATNSPQRSTSPTHRFCYRATFWCATPVMRLPPVGERESCSPAEW